MYPLNPHVELNCREYSLPQYVLSNDSKCNENVFHLSSNAWRLYEISIFAIPSFI